MYYCLFMYFTNAGEAAFTDIVNPLLLSLAIGYGSYVLFTLFTRSWAKSVLGAVMCAGIGAGLFTDCVDAVNKCVKITKTYKPDPKKVADYEAAFKVWERCYTISNQQIYQ